MSQKSGLRPVTTEAPWRASKAVAAVTTFRFVESGWKTPALYATGFLITFTYGGLTGFFLAAIPADYHEHGTYFVVAHFHYVLYGGSIMSLFAGLYYWWPKMTGRMYNEKLGQLQFWLTFIGFNATFTPMHWLGLMGMPRRVATYDPQFTFWNQFASISSYVMAAGALRPPPHGQGGEEPNPSDSRHTPQSAPSETTATVSNG